LDLSKIESGEFKLEEVPFCPEKQIRAVVKMLGPKWKSKGLNVQLQVEGEEGSDLDSEPNMSSPSQIVVGDPGNFKIVLTNLLLNAIKFTNEGIITIRMSQEQERGPLSVRTTLPTNKGLLIQNQERKEEGVRKGKEKEQEGAEEEEEKEKEKEEAVWLRIEVTDTGIGMTPEQMERLFRRFSQVGSLGGKEEGSGLGLVISKNLTTLMGGDLTVTSELGKGTTFVFTLQCKAASLDNNFFDSSLSLISSTSTNSSCDSSPMITTIPGGSSSSSSSSSCSSSSSSYSSSSSHQLKRILVVDDNCTNRKLLTWMLEKKRTEWSCESANEGSEALALLDQQEGMDFDLILLDVRMSPMDGLNFCRTIRNSKKWFSELPVIGMSGDTDEESIRRTKEAGMNDFLPKPFSKEELWAKIERWS
jgi:CheY-like chemotaxis protein